MCCSQAQKSSLFVFFLSQFSYSLIPQAVETDGEFRHSNWKKLERAFSPPSLLCAFIKHNLKEDFPPSLPATHIYGRTFFWKIVAAWSGTSQPLHGLQGFHRAQQSQGWAWGAELCRRVQRAVWEARGLCCWGVRSGSVLFTVGGSIDKDII